MLGAAVVVSASLAVAWGAIICIAWHVLETGSIVKTGTGAELLDDSGEHVS